MLNTQNFLDALDNLTFVKYEDKTLHTAEGFKISYELELMGGAMSKYPIQFTFRVRKGKLYVRGWGCGDNEDNILANIWWQKKVYAMQELKRNKRDAKQSKANKLFQELTILKLSL
jgi:hypothetical protein